MSLMPSVMETSKQLREGASQEENEAHMRENMIGTWGQCLKEKEMER